jgi:hypothetical protein
MIGRCFAVRIMIGVLLFVMSDNDVMCDCETGACL